jgi:TfoX/Sxy family transcriptional regulator of competence genes
MSLEDRVDNLSSHWQPVKKRMFSGFGYMVNGNLAFGIHKQDQLIVRAGEDKSSQLLKQPGIRVFDMTGRPMKNWFMAKGEAIDSDEKLKQLLQIGYEFAKSLPENEALDPGFSVAVLGKEYSLQELYASDFFVWVNNLEQAIEAAAAFPEWSIIRATDALMLKMAIAHYQQDDPKKFITLFIIEDLLAR